MHGSLRFFVDTLCDLRFLRGSLIFKSVKEKSSKLPTSFPRLTLSHRTPGGGSSGGTLTLSSRCDPDGTAPAPSEGIVAKMSSGDQDVVSSHLPAGS